MAIHESPLRRYTVRVSLPELPLFPLNTVLFPGGILPLRIFEPRYLDMVKSCMRNQHGFGVCMIIQGEEVGHNTASAALGCEARIVDFDQTALLDLRENAVAAFAGDENLVHAGQALRRLHPLN